MPTITRRAFGTGGPAAFPFDRAELRCARGRRQGRRECKSPSFASVLSACEPRPLPAAWGLRPAPPNASTAAAHWRHGRARHGGMPRISIIVALVRRNPRQPGGTWGRHARRGTPAYTAARQRLINATFMSGKKNNEEKRMALLIRLALPTRPCCRRACAGLCAPPARRGNSPENGGPREATDQS